VRPEGCPVLYGPGATSCVACCWNLTYPNPAGRQDVQAPAAQDQGAPQEAAEYDGAPSPEAKGDAGTCLTALGGSTTRRDGAAHPYGEVVRQVGEGGRASHGRGLFSSLRLVAETSRRSAPSQPREPLPSYQPIPIRYAATFISQHIYPPPP